MRKTNKKGGLAGNTNFYLWFYLPLRKPYTPTSLPDNEQLPTKAPSVCVCVFYPKFTRD